MRLVALTFLISLCVPAGAQERSFESPLADVKDSFGERPWMEDGGAYPVTVREHGPVTRLPPNKSERKCI